MESELEEMESFFNKRADTYDDHMLIELDLNEFYQSVENCFDSTSNNIRILDLGCGTGLELEKIFIKCPNAEVTCIDLAENMLKKLCEKFKDKNIKIIKASYLDIDLGSMVYDSVISTYSLHHFTVSEKLKLFTRIFQSLKPGGIFVNGDYTAQSKEKETLYAEEFNRIKKIKGTKNGLYHFDIPFTADTEVDLLNSAGFSNVQIYRQWENTTIFKASR
jgi:tRNA (cmo5U34)-methyltransferase